MSNKFSNRIYIAGPGFGTDAPSGYFGPDGKWHPIPGWNPEAFVDLARSLSVLQLASQIKERALSEGLVKSVLPAVHTQLGEHLSDGGVLVVGR